MSNINIWFLTHNTLSDQEKLESLHIFLKLSPFFFLLVVITTAQLHLTKPKLRFCAGSNPARCVGDFAMVRMSDTSPGWK